MEKKTSLIWAIGFSSCLFIFKLGAALYCASQALLASALDSLMDIGISSLNLFSVKKSAEPPDEEHTYGHEKIESLASYTQGIAILLVSLVIAVNSVKKAFEGQEIFHTKAALIVIAVSSLANFAIIAILKKAQSKNESLILKAEGAHYLMDILSYAVIFTALLLVNLTDWHGWDFIGGLLVAGYVGYLAVEILLQAGSELVDRALPRRVIRELNVMIKRHDRRIVDYHELRTRKVGAKVFIDFHLEIEPRQSFKVAHDIADSLIEKIRKRYPNADVTIHEDLNKDG
ncbi:MAG TPA: cation diffusion facilitator family transporter [Candidatus Omnitrophota bacterium]|nr:cation diffusion facilitator family transporter [Candidatus Omnitrophota bacterium]